jgi:D-beta-D-heptose 7-phosphate kinase/D-beta-D-heptose 1-phosphate adenosyltransferase
MPGGAGNTCANLAGLGCEVVLIGICGIDEAGESIVKLIEENQIKNEIMFDSTRSTTTKIRIIAQGQQLVRLDKEKRAVLSAEITKRLLNIAERKLSSCHALVLSDYGKGVLQTPGLCTALVDLARERNIPVLIDPKGDGWDRYVGATCVTPNTSELEMISSTDLSEENKLIRVARSVRRNHEIVWLVVTRGERGMCIIGPEDSVFHIRAKAREVFDISGAGDTVIATLAAGIALGLAFPDAAQLSNLAAGIVVGKLGTKPINLIELKAALLMSGMEGKGIGAVKIAGLNTAAILVNAWRSNRETIVFTNGCFDLLHPGHIYLLNEAKALGNRLVVGLNSDASVERLKGRGRPIFCEDERAALIGALDCVDLVVVFEEDIPQSLITALQPDLLVKGGDYALEEVVGREIVEASGGKVRIIPLLEGFSATDIANRIDITFDSLKDSRNQKSF